MSRPASLPTSAPASPSPADRLGRPALGWRVAVSVLGVVALLIGSLRLSDDVWPFGPMSQYAFSPAPGDSVVITRVEGERADGVRVDLPLRAGVSGIGRAEVEAQIPAIRADPALLRVVADGYARSHPRAARFVTVWLVQDVTVLEPGRAAVTRTVDLASWPTR